MTTHAQNFVTNGDFEQYNQCPTTTSQTDRCTGWWQYNASTPDYMNACHTQTIVDVPLNTFGTQPAASGDAYMGGYSYHTDPGNFNIQYKEHVVTQILPLIKNMEYEISMSVSLSDKSAFATDDLGVLFYDNGPSAPVTGYSLQTPPQIKFKSFGMITDMNNWVRVSATFVADSAYDHIVIGSFSSYSTINVMPVTQQIPHGSKYCYYYYDSVVLRLTTNFLLNYTDTFVCRGDSIDVPYTVLNNGFFLNGNIFTLQLSDAGGSFANPLNIGSIASISSGIVKGYIPPTLPKGTGYKLRLVSSMDKDTTQPTIDAIHISDIKAVLTANITSPLCTGDDIIGEVSSLPSLTTYTWKGPAMASVTGQKITVNNAQVSHSGQYIVYGEYEGCRAYDTVNLIVQPLPDVLATGNGPLCPGDTLLLGAAVLPGKGRIRYINCQR